MTRVALGSNFAPMLDLAYPLDELQSRCKNSMVENLGIEFTSVGPDFLEGRMPVDHRTLQPAGVMHGGASAAFAETLGSAASYLCINRETELTFGLEININHVKAVREGWVFGRAEALHLGRQTHIWQITIRNEAGALVAVSRHTCIIMPIPASDAPKG